MDVEGSEILKTRFQGFFLGKHVFHADVRMSGIFEDVVFTQEKQEAEFELKWSHCPYRCSPAGVSVLQLISLET